MKNSYLWRGLTATLLAVSASLPVTAEEAQAVFAGGCFWCMEPPYDNLEGVKSTISGYTGGRLPNPTYRQVGDGDSGHVEAVQVTYDPAQISYEELLQVFWHNIDPLDNRGQFCDKGSEYLSAVFYLNETQRKLALASKKALEESGRFKETIVTEIRPASIFYPAEEYHQDYYIKNPVRYKLYRGGCGRDRRLEDLWGEK
jgi:peptide-methionine (S)-S-oxide reductase